ncbi:MAG: recombinase family protein, partial [Patescibacteria group bacterium]
MNNTGLKYIIYSRKSQENRDRQVLSIGSQISELREFAQKEGLMVVKELQESQTAFKPGRPVFAQMMEMLELGMANAVLVWKADRIARNAKEGGEFIQAIDDGFVEELRTPYERLKREDNRMMLYIHFGMSNDYSRQISANVKRGNREKHRRGEFIGKAPLGYLNSKINNSTNIVPDPEKVHFVIKLFQEFSTGNYSVMDMVRKAESWNLKSVFGRPIAKSGMYTLLKRHLYYGMYKHAGEYHQGSYEPLISKELFDKVQGILVDRTKPRRKNWVHAYTNLLKCPECGCSITSSTKVKSYKRAGNTKSYTYY